MAKTREFFVEQGRRGGKIGGKLRARLLSAKKRRDIAKKAAETRWDGKSTSKT